MPRQITNTAEGQTSEPLRDGWELINVMSLPVKVWTSTVVSTNCLKVSLLIVLIKTVIRHYVNTI